MLVFKVIYIALYEWEWIEISQAELWSEIKRGLRWLFVYYKQVWSLFGYKLWWIAKPKFVQSDDGEDNAEFSMINPDLLHLDLVNSDSESNVPVVLTIIDRLLLLMNSFM